MTQCEGKTDEVLVERVLTEREYFGCLIERYEAKLRRYLRRIMPGIREEEDDVLQEIFIKTFMNVRGFDTNLSFSSWIYRIAHNEAVSWLRKKSIRPQVVELSDDELALLRESVREAFELRERSLTNDAVMRALFELPERYRDVLVLHFLEGKTYEEISHILTIPVGTVGTHMHRAKKIFSNVYTTQHEQATY